MPGLNGDDKLDTMMKCVGCFNQGPTVELGVHGDLPRHIVQVFLQVAPRPSRPLPQESSHRR